MMPEKRKRLVCLQPMYSVSQLPKPTTATAQAPSLTCCVIALLHLQLAQVRAAAEKLSQSRRKMQLQHDALQSLGGPGGYAASGASTDFGGTLASRRAALAEQNQEEDEVMTRFEELAKFTEEDEQIDDGIAIAGGSGLDLAKNSKCPITLKDVRMRLIRLH